MPPESPSPARGASRPIRGLLAGLLLGFLPGLWAVDSWVGWLDRDQGSQKDYYLPDEHVGWLPRPHFEEAELGTALDRFGMRNAEIPADAPGDEVRILGVGASRLYGAVGVQQSATWGYDLQSMLDGLHPGRVRVLNGSVMAYSAVQICRRAIALMDMEKEGVAVSPDLLLVCLSPTAQMMLDPSRTRHWVRVGEDLIDRELVAGWPEFLRPLRVDVHQLMLKSNLFVRKRAKFELTDEDGLDSSLQFWSYSSVEQPPAVRELVEKTFTEYAALKAAAERRGIELRIVLLPDAQEDGEERWDNFVRNFGSLGAPPPGTPRLEGVRLLKEKMEELGLVVWDFTEEVTKIGSDPPRFYQSDKVHWSPDGHWVIAMGMIKRLQSERLIERLLAARAANPRD